MSRFIRISRILPVVAVGAIGIVALGAPTSQGGDPFVAGGRSTRAAELSATQAEQAKAHGRQLAAALALPGVSQRVVRLDDRFEHRTYDEVTSVDATGRDVAVARFETDGRLAMALVLGWQPGHGMPIDPSAVETRGLGLVKAAGLAVAGRPNVVASAGSGGWSITWRRLVDGTPVRGDGVRVALWADGSFHGLSRIERPLAAAPARPIAAGAARKAAETWAGGHFGSASADVRISTIERAWVAPNGAFAANGLDAPAETLRLAWVVQFETRGALAMRLRSIETWLDATDGAVIGGDVIE
ncbi:MAG TPA: hypothetical protein VFY18_13730 [Candidatus Limnocylindrales bacterium]|nr:hypothetical protein [Candidatus Limnocylindrales bacterium]